VRGFQAEFWLRRLLVGGRAGKKSFSPSYLVVNLILRVVPLSLADPRDLVLAGLGPILAFVKNRTSCAPAVLLTATGALTKRFWAELPRKLNCKTWVLITPKSGERSAVPTCERQWSGCDSQSRCLDCQSKGVIPILFWSVVPWLLSGQLDVWLSGLGVTMDFANLASLVAETGGCLAFDVRVRRIQYVRSGSGSDMALCSASTSLEADFWR